jgi:hypothetical protein
MSGLSRLQIAIVKAALDYRAYLRSDMRVDIRGVSYTKDKYLYEHGWDFRMHDALPLASAANGRSAAASVSRSMRRLEERGLIIIGGTMGTGRAIKVTPLGEAMVNKHSG